MVTFVPIKMLFFATIIMIMYYDVPINTACKKRDFGHFERGEAWTVCEKKNVIFLFSMKR